MTEHYGLDDHRSCRENFAQVLEPYGISYLRVPDPINWFMNVPVAPDGTLGLEVSPTEAGDKVVLRALMDVVIVASACPQDQNVINDWEPTDIRLLVWDPSQ